MTVFTPDQCRAARALLNWTQDDLATAAEVGFQTVRNFEVSKGEPRRSTSNAMRLALENGGVIFLDPSDTEGVGVRLRK